MLLQKPQSAIETYNDLNGDVVNFYKVLRERTEELLHLVLWTPWAREEFKTSLQPTDDPLERARRWWVYHTMSVNAAPYQMNPDGWMSYRFDSKHLRLTTDRDNRPEIVRNLATVAERMRRVQIESEPMNQLMMRHDAPLTMFYVDPPYVSETRSHGTNMYGVEWSDSDHSEFIEIVQNLQGFCVISGYACELYEPLERAGWQREDKVAVNNSGDTRTESLWLCPRTVEASRKMLF